MSGMEKTIMVIVTGFILFSLVGFFVVNGILSLIKVHIVKKKYKKTNSVDETDYTKKLFVRYFQLPIAIITSILNGLIIGSVIHISTFWNYFIIILLMGMSYMLVLLMDHMIFHNTQKLIKENVQTRKEKAWNIIKSMFIITIPVGLLLSVYKFLSNSEGFANILGRYAAIIVPGITVLIVLFFHYMVKHLIKPKPLEETSLAERLNNFANKMGFEGIHFYVWPGKKRKHANAFIFDLFKKNIYLTDYLLENFSQEEIEGLVAHEIGHIKKHHLIIRRVLALCCMLFILNLMKMLHNAHGILIFKLFLMVMVSGILFILLLKYISRVQENQADDYVVKESGVDPVVFANFLRKLSQLNHTVLKFNRVDEKFKTHLGTEKRIRRIEKMIGKKIEHNGNI